MEQPNWWIFLVAAIIPLLVGAIWYNPGVFGNTWMREAEITEERAQSGNKIKIFGLTYLFSVFAAYLIAMFAVHQTSIFQLFMGDPAMADTSSEIYGTVTHFMDNYGERHRSFGHGIIHGLELGLLMGLVMIGIHSMFERRSWKYIMVHVGYWIVCFALMGGVICVYF